jgi:hypothetical protein
MPFYAYQSFSCLSEHFMLINQRPIMGHLMLISANCLWEGYDGDLMALLIAHAQAMLLGVYLLS